MRRGLVAVAILAVAAGAVSHASGDRQISDVPALLQRFLANDSPKPMQYRALRRLEAANERYGQRAWMDVWTEADGTGFRYDVVHDGGSGLIRSRVFLPALDAERDMWRSGAPEHARFTADNYTFGECRNDVEGFECIGVTPRRKDMLLVDGSIFLRPEDGELVRVQGLLAKTPSFWTRRVEVVREFDRIGGVRMPVSFKTMANVLFAGASSFTMTYTYESVNGLIVGSPTAPAVH